MVKTCNVHISAYGNGKPHFLKLQLRKQVKKILESTEDFVSFITYDLWICEVVDL